MADFESPYAAHLQPFPVGSVWRTTLEMVEDVFSDLREPWVQNFVLRSDPKQDVDALTDPKNYLRAMSLFYSGRSIPELSGGFESNSFHVRLNIPVLAVGDVGVGLGVECSDATGVVFSKSDQFFRSVFNSRNNSQLNVRVLDSDGKIEAGFQHFAPNGFWQYAILAFDQALFLQAFDGLTYTVDFEKIRSALIRSIVGGCHRPTPSKLIGNGSFPYKVADNGGESIWKNIFCSYANAQPMMAFPVFSHGTITFDYNAEGLRKMRNWGITNRLHRVRISPTKDIRISTNAFIDFILGEADNNNNNGIQKKKNNAVAAEKRRSRKPRNRPLIEANTNTSANLLEDVASPGEDVVDILPLLLSAGDLLPHISPTPVPVADHCVSLPVPSFSSEVSFAPSISSTAPISIDDSEYLLPISSSVPPASVPTSIPDSEYLLPVSSVPPPLPTTNSISLPVSSSSSAPFAPSAQPPPTNFVYHQPVPIAPSPPTSDAIPAVPSSPVAIAPSILTNNNSVPIPLPSSSVAVAIVPSVPPPVPTGASSVHVVPALQPQPVIQPMQPAQEMQFVNIAPFPQPQQPEKPAPQHLTEEEKAKAKAERRKLQKREAAQRFNARKAAERIRNKKNKKKT